MGKGARAGGAPERGDGREAEWKLKTIGHPIAGYPYESGRSRRVGNDPVTETTYDRYPVGTGAIAKG